MVHKGESDTTGRLIRTLRPRGPQTLPKVTEAGTQVSGPIIWPYSLSSKGRVQTGVGGGRRVSREEVVPLSPGGKQS